MHEMALAIGILQIVEDSVLVQPFQRVRRIVVEIGELSAVDTDSLCFCFDAVARSTLAEGAALDVIAVAGQGLCFNCGKTVALGSLYDPCPDCGGYPVQATAGTAMRVKELEVE